MAPVQTPGIVPCLVLTARISRVFVSADIVSCCCACTGKERRRSASLIEAQALAALTSDADEIAASLFDTQPAKKAFVEKKEKAKDTTQETKDKANKVGSPKAVDGKKPELARVQSERGAQKFGID